MKIGDLGGLALLMVTVGVLIGAGAFVLDNFEQEFDTGSVAENATLDALGAIDEIGDWLDLIVIIAIAAIIIGLVSMFGMAGGRRR